MKKYTLVEIFRAREKAPRPINDFIDSIAWQNIIDGIERKFNFSVDQKSLVNSILVATTTKLESDGALETNIHQLLPELSNEKTKELAADIRDRVLKEAERRVTENITDPRFDWDENVLGEKPTVEQLEARKKRFHEETQKGLSVEEIKRLAEEDARKQQEQEEREDAEYIAAKKARGETVLTEEEGGGVEVAENSAPEGVAPVSINSSGLAAATEALASTPPIAIQKLSTVSGSGQKSSVVDGVLPAQSTQNIQKVEAAAPTPRLRGDNDPYREPID